VEVIEGEMGVHAASSSCALNGLAT
jgi:hypothetical protein